MKYIAFAILTVALGGLSASAANLPAEKGAKISSISDGRLSLSGPMDVRDLVTLKEDDAKVDILDLRDAEICQYTYSKPSYLGRSLFKAKMLPSYIFFRAHYKEVILPENLYGIEAGAFAGSDIEAVSIPEGVEIIGDYAFYGCKSLHSISLPSTLKSIGKGAFASCPLLNDIDLAATKVKSIPERCFADDYSLDFLRLPADIEQVGSEAFKATAINELILPSVKNLAPYALSGMTALESVTLNKDANFNEGTLMNNGSLTRISGVPANLPTLFAANCYSFVPSEILAEADVVGDYAFSNATVDQLILAPSIVRVGKGSFSGLTSLTRIDAQSLDAAIPEVEKDSFDGIDPSQVLLYVTDDSFYAWQAHPVWSQFQLKSPNFTTATEEIKVEDCGINISLAANQLNISATEPILNGVVFSLDGRALAYLQGGATEETISLDDIDDKIIIVSVATASDKKTAKIVK